MQQLNNSNDGYTYTINTRQQAYIISKGNKQTKKAYAYEIHVTQSWNRTEVVYEDVFDSYSMDLNTFKAQLNARLSEFNDNEEGYVYYHSIRWHGTITATGQAGKNCRDAKQ